MRECPDVYAAFGRGDTRVPKALFQARETAPYRQPRLSHMLKSRATVSEGFTISMRTWTVG